MPPSEDSPNRNRAAIWVRCDDPRKTPVLLELERIIQAENPNIWFEITTPRDSGAFMWHPIRAKEITKFCETLRPRLVLWVGGVLDATTLTCCQTNAILVAVVDGGVAMLPKVGRGWFPGKTRSLLTQLTQVFVRSPEAADSLMKAGVHADRIIISGSLQATGEALPCDEEERYEMAQKIGPRPMWLAAQSDISEVPLILKAHRGAARRSHRLLCVIAPSDDPAAQVETIKAAGFSVSSALAGELPTDVTQVHVADPADIALWCRLAPVTYIGGSLTTAASIDPYHLATVGSVAIHGRNMGTYAAHFDNLMSADATFVCDSPDILGQAVAHLLSADKTALYAQRGWEVTSQGAEVLEHLSRFILSYIDPERFEHA